MVFNHSIIPLKGIHFVTFHFVVVIDGDVSELFQNCCFERFTRLDNFRDVEGPFA